MPHAVVFDSPIAFMTTEEELAVRSEVEDVALSVTGAGFEGRQVRLALPSSEKIIRTYKPFVVVRFAYVKDRSEATLHNVCRSIAMHLHDGFKGVKVRHRGIVIEPVQYDFEIDFAGRFGQWPPKETKPQ